MADNTFYIGVTVDEVYDFFPLTTWFENFNRPVDPDWTFSPYAAFQEQADAGRRGVGFPRVTWTWNHRKDAHVEVLRTICPGLSASVAIRTPLNETVSGVKQWGTFTGIMLWPPNDEDKQAGYTLGFVLEFRRLILVP